MLAPAIIPRREWRRLGYFADVESTKRTDPDVPSHTMD